MARGMQDVFSKRRDLGYTRCLAPLRHGARHGNRCLDEVGLEIAGPKIRLGTSRVQNLAGCNAPPFTRHFGHRACGVPVHHHLHIMDWTIGLAIRTEPEGIGFTMPASVPSLNSEINAA